MSQNRIARVLAGAFAVFALALTLWPAAAIAAVTARYHIPGAVKLASGVGGPTDFDVSGDYVVWTAGPVGSRHLRLYNIATGVVATISPGPADQYRPRISGNLVVWVDERNGNPDIYAYDISSKATAAVCTDTAVQTDSAVDDGLVVWTDLRNDAGDIYSRERIEWPNLGFATESQLSSEGVQASPDVHNRKIAWTYAGTPRMVALLDYSSGQSTWLTGVWPAPNVQTPCIGDEDVVLWESGMVSDWQAVYGLDGALRSSVGGLVGAYPQAGAHDISGKRLVYSTFRAFDYPVGATAACYLRDLNDLSVETTLTLGGTSAVRIDGEHVVWWESTDSGGEVYLYEIGSTRQDLVNAIGRLQAEVRVMYESNVHDVAEAQANAAFYRSDPALGLANWSGIVLGLLKQSSGTVLNAFKLLHIEPGGDGLPTLSKAWQDIGSAIDSADAAPAKKFTDGAMMFLGIISTDSTELEQRMGDAMLTGLSSKSADADRAYADSGRSISVAGETIYQQLLTADPYWVNMRGGSMRGRTGVLPAKESTSTLAGARERINDTFEDLQASVLATELPTGYPIEEVVAQLDYLSQAVAGYGGVDFPPIWFPDVPDTTKPAPTAVEMKTANTGQTESQHRVEGLISGSLTQESMRVTQDVWVDGVGCVTNAVSFYAYGKNPDVRTVTSIGRVAYDTATTADSLVSGDMQLLKQDLEVSPSQLLMRHESEMLWSLPVTQGELWTLADGVANYVRYTLEPGHDAAAGTFMDPLAYEPNDLMLVGRVRIPLGTEGRQVRLERFVGSKWMALDVTATVGSTGLFEFTSIDPVVATRYRAVFEGSTSDGLARCTSPEVLAKPLARVYVPVAPASVRRARAFSVYGYVAPKHTSGTYLVTLKFYRRNSKGVYVYHHSVKARRYYYSTTKTKYKATVSLPHAGRWRVRAYHSDAGHAPSYSGYDYITVK